MLTYVTDYLLHTSPQSEQLESLRPTAVIPLAPVIDPQDLYMRVERAFGQLYGAHVSANDKDVIDALGKRVSLLAPYIRQQTSAHASAYVSIRQPSTSTISPPPVSGKHVSSK